MHFVIDDSMAARLLKIFSFIKNQEFPIALSSDLTPEAGLGSVRLQAMEGSVFIDLSFSASVKKEGEAVIPAKYLRWLTGVAGPVEFQKYKNDLDVSNYKIPFYTGEVPSMPQPVPSGSVTLELSKLKSLLSQVEIALSNEKDSGHRYNWDCVLLEFDRQYMKAVCWNGFVLAVARIEKGSPYKGSFILPKPAISVLSRLEGDLVSLTFFETAGASEKAVPIKHIRFSISGEIMCELHIPEYSRVYVRYEDLLQIKPNTTVQGDKTDFLQMLCQVKPVSSKVTFKMSFGSDYVARPFGYSARESNGPGAIDRTTSALKWHGEELKIAVNADCLEDAIRTAPGKTVTLSFTNNMGSFAVTGEDDSYIAVLQPYTNT